MDFNDKGIYTYNDAARLLKIKSKRLVKLFAYP